MKKREGRGTLTLKRSETCQVDTGDEHDLQNFQVDATG